MYNSVSIDHSIMLPHISNDDAHHTSFSNPLDSVRNKLAQLNMSSDNANRAHRKQMPSEGNQKDQFNKTDLEKMSKRNKIKQCIKKGTDSRGNGSALGNHDKKLNLNKFEFMSLESERSEFKTNGNDSIMKNF